MENSGFHPKPLYTHKDGHIENPAQKQLVADTPIVQVERNGMQ